MGGYKISYFDSINLRPSIRLKLSYLASQGGASLRMDAQQSNQDVYDHTQMMSEHDQARSVRLKSRKLKTLFFSFIKLCTFLIFYVSLLFPFIAQRKSEIPLIDNGACIAEVQLLLSYYKYVQLLLYYHNYGLVHGAYL
jgi:hypothetical protein